MTRAPAALAVIAMIGATATWAQDAARQNLLHSPGFEELDGEVPKGWTISGEAEFVTDPAVAHSGERCVRARFEDGAAQQIAIEGGAAYRITGWIRRVQPGGAEVPKIKVYFLDADGGRADVQAAPFEDITADEWTRWETVMQAPFNAVTLNLTLRGFFGGSEWFYYDDLAVQQVPAISWPRPEDTPDLHGITVTVPDIADVWTDALLRIPPASQSPADGVLDSSALLRGESVRVELQRPIQASWALIHTMRPEMNLGDAALLGRGPRDPILGAKMWTILAGSEPKDELITSLQFEPREVNEVTLHVPDHAEVYLNELQLLGLSEDGSLPGERVQMGLVEGPAPDSVAEDLPNAFAAEEHRDTLVAAEGQQAEGSVELPAEEHLNVFAAPGGESYGLAGLSLDLVLPDASDGDMVEIALKRPEELDVNVRWVTYTDRGIERPAGERRDYATVFRVVSMVADGRLSVSFDVPDLVYAVDEPVWLTLRPRRDMTLDLAQSGLALNVIPPQDAHAEYLPQLERLVRRMYSDASEAHVYDGRDWSEMIIGDYVRRVLELDPDNMPATYIYRRIAHVKEPVELQRPGPADAPDWAVWAREALRNRHEIITWWLDNRQQANGELAGHINDDGEFSCNWPSHYLMTGDERIADGLRKLADVAWEMSAGTGYTVGSRDVEHAAEDQSCTQPQVLLVDYGNPQALERFMTMSSYLDFWTAINEVGRRQFKSYMFNTKQIWDDPPFDIDQPYCPLSMVGTGHLVWYTHSPQIERIFLEEAESWALACLSTDKGKPAGQIPKEILFRNSEIDPYEPYPSNPILQKRSSLYRNGAGAYIVQYFIRGAHALTNDDPWAEVVALWEPSDEEKVARAQETLATFRDPDSSWRPSQTETDLYDAWRATGDRSWLVGELKEVVRQQIRSRWLLTEAEPYTDRVPVPGRTLLSRMFLGDWTSGKSHVSGHWVSWEGGGLDYAALILDARPDHLKALVHSFHERPTPMTMRVWRLPHGRYEVTVGVDSDGDDQPDAQVRTEEQELWRYDGAVQFDARPGETLVIELRLLEQLEDIRERPDLALRPEDVTVEDGALTVTVHNVGGSRSPLAWLEVYGEGGAAIGRARIRGLRPPHNLEPSTVDVRVRLDGDAEPARVVLDPDGEISEITEANNMAEVGT
ncbi:MAG: CARDB domain-containing protein [Armatimonadota bacterium]